MSEHRKENNKMCVNKLWVWLKLQLRPSKRLTRHAGKLTWSYFRADYKKEKRQFREK